MITNRAPRIGFAVLAFLFLINSTSAGIFADNSSHLTIEKNYTYNTFSSGIGIWDSDNIIGRRMLS